EIVTQPESVATEAGKTVELSVVASGLGNLSYQWYKGFDELPGETSDVLTLSGVDAGDAGEYYVEVTDDAAEADGQPATAIFSSAAIVAVFEPWEGLVSHDPFDVATDYTEGALATQNPTVAGYTDAWAITNGFGPVSPVVSSVSLVHPNPLYLGSSGG